MRKLLIFLAIILWLALLSLIALIGYEQQKMCEILKDKDLQSFEQYCL